MTKFQQINGQLCRMVEPTPLQQDSPMPCVVRLIQDDSRLGILNKLLHEGCYQDVFICSSCNEQVCHISIDGEEYDDFYPKYEIIGYPVVEGSIEWAWYQRCMLDIPVIGPNGVTPNNNFTLKQWCGQYSLTSMKTGWRLYEPEPEPDFRVGDWVRDCQSGDGIITSYLDYAPREDYGDYVKSEAMTHCDDVEVTLTNGKKIITKYRLLTKLSPSEVVVDFGSFRGWVKRASNYNIDVYSKNNCWLAAIRYDMLDPATRSLVESLLKAQEEK